MSLTDAHCRSAKPGDRPVRLRDSAGLYLVVSVAGTKTWLYRYEIQGREKSLTIGRYPSIGLGEARKARDRAREQVEAGVDPSAAKQQRKESTRQAAIDSLEATARAWHSQKRKNWAPRYASAVLARLEGNVFPTLGRKGVASITSPEVLQAIRAIEARGAHVMAHRVVNHLSAVFVWAIAAGLAERDPAATIRNALAPTDPRKRPALVEIDQLRELLRESEAKSGAHWSTLLASRLTALTAARPGVIRLAEISEFEELDGEEPIWRIPAAKMKLTSARKRDVTWEFVIPLSRQAAATARAAIAATPSSNLLFCGIGSWKTPMSDSTMSDLYRECGYRGRHVPHGWRASFSTIMNERAGREGAALDNTIIDLMLAHAQPGVEWVYNRAAYLPRRRELAQDWADMLMAGLPPPEDLLPPNRARRAVEPGRERRASKRR